jgi:hypothetical protein
MLCQTREGPVAKHPERYQQPSNDIKMKTDSEEEEPTPRPMKTKDRYSGSEYSDVEQDEHFQTPLTLKKPKNRKPVVDIVLEDSTLSELSDVEESEQAENSKGIKLMDGHKRAPVHDHHNPTCCLLTTFTLVLL